MEFRVKALFRYSRILFRTSSRNSSCDHVDKLHDSSQEKTKDVECGSFKIESGLDIEALFLDKRVREILKNVTGLDMKRVFRTRQAPLSTPKYRFLTDKQLEKLMKEAENFAHEKLQMPPVMKERKPINEVISEDPELQGYDDCQYVFTDITYGASDRKRLIVTRHPDGKLCHASWDQRHRMNCIYFPTPERSFDIPKMFDDEHLEKVLNRQDYEFILDRACVQFDPDDPIYIKTTHKTYEHINETKKFDDLNSTRHFGPMVFYFAITKNIDNLLLHMIQKIRIEDAANIVRLYYIIHPSSEVTESDDAINYIQNYIETDAKKKSALQLAIQTYIELYQSVIEDKNSSAI